MKHLKKCRFLYIFPYGACDCGVAALKCIEKQIEEVLNVEGLLRKCKEDLSIMKTEFMLKFSDRMREAFEEEVIVKRTRRMK